MTASRSPRVAKPIVHAFVACAALGILTLLESQILHRAGFFVDENIVSTLPSKILQSLDERRWVLVRVPSSFRGPPWEFLHQQKIWQNDENANWAYPLNRCAASISERIEKADTQVPFGDEFWFASGYPAPDREQRPVLPPHCNDGS